jgi:hypothetical protein
LETCYRFSSSRFGRKIEVQQRVEASTTTSALDDAAGVTGEAIEVHQVRCLFTALEKRLEFTPGRMLTFEAVAANLRLVRQWAKRIGLTDEPLCEALPPDHGFEELDANGQMCLSEPFLFDDPPDDLAT